MDAFACIGEDGRRRGADHGLSRSRSLYTVIYILDSQALLITATLLFSPCNSLILTVSRNKA